MKKALIIGVGGQDGYYLCELLLSKGYAVLGTVKTSQSLQALQSKSNHSSNCRFEILDVLEPTLLANLIEAFAPDELYNLAAESRGTQLFSSPTRTCEVNGLFVARMLQYVREIKPNTRVFQASSAEMYGVAHDYPQHEQTPFLPISPYGIAKLFAHQMCKCYRESYGLHVSCGILFNHESPRRSIDFVSRKITSSAARIFLGIENELKLGNLNVSRDWSFAGDFVEGMWQMLQEDSPDDYVLASGESHTVREFTELAFHTLGLDYRKYLREDEALTRTRDVHKRCGDPIKIKKCLGWNPKTSFESLVQLMIECELETLSSPIERKP